MRGRALLGCLLLSTAAHAGVADLTGPALPTDPPGTLPYTRHFNYTDTGLVHWAAHGAMYVKLDGKFYPVLGTNDGELYAGLILLDGAQATNCHRSGGGTVTHSTAIFVGNNGAAYVYLSTTSPVNIRSYPGLSIMELHSKDGDLVCDMALNYDPTDLLYKNGFDASSAPVPTAPLEIQISGTFQ